MHASICVKTHKQITTYEILRPWAFFSAHQCSIFEIFSVHTRGGEAFVTFFCEMWALTSLDLSLWHKMERKPWMIWSNQGHQLFKQAVWHTPYGMMCAFHQHTCIDWYSFFVFLEWLALPWLNDQGFQRASGWSWRWENHAQLQKRANLLYKNTDRIFDVWELVNILNRKGQLWPSLFLCLRSEMYFWWLWWLWLRGVSFSCRCFKGVDGLPGKKGNEGPRGIKVINCLNFNLFFTQVDDRQG